MSRTLAFLAVVVLAAAGCSGGSSNGSGGNGGTGGTSGSGGASVTGGSGQPSPLGTLWIGGSGALSPAELIDGGQSPSFGQTCTPPGYSGTSPVDGVEVIDGHGNLWAQFPDGTVGALTAPIYMWSASQLDSCASHPPAATFPLTDTVYCGGDGAECVPFFSVLAFDPAGNLWGAEGDSNSIFVYRASDLAGGGQSLTAAAIVLGQQCGPLDVLCTPIGLAFDSAGTLWIGNGYSVIAYSPATQAAILAGGAGAPPADLLLTNSVALSFDAGVRGGYYSHYTYNYLAFDRSGDLWATIYNGQGNIEQQIVEFSAAQLGDLATNSTPIPILTVTETSFQQGHTFLGWDAIAFDAEGSLWAGATSFEPNLYRFSPASLSGSGLPDITLTVTGDPSVSLAFDPIPPGLPLRP